MTWEVMTMAGLLRVPRSRGALSGILLILLGVWGALIPFIGPSFHYAYTPDATWTYTYARLWLEILPGAAAVLGGLIVLGSAMRPSAVFGAWLAALAGAWFVVGQPLSRLWTASGAPAGGHPIGGPTRIAVEQIGFFYGLGAVIIFFAALALGRFTIVGVREAALAADRAPAGALARDPVDDRPVAREPVAREPVAREPVADRPVAREPVADRPVADRVAARDPAADDTAAQPTVVSPPAEDPATGTGRHSVGGSHAAP